MYRLLDFDWAWPQSTETEVHTTHNRKKSLIYRHCLDSRFLRLIFPSKTHYGYCWVSSKCARTSHWVRECAEKQNVRLKSNLYLSAVQRKKTSRKLTNRAYRLITHPIELTAWVFEKRVQSENKNVINSWTAYGAPHPVQSREIFMRVCRGTCCFSWLRVARLPIRVPYSIYVFALLFAVGMRHSFRCILNLSFFFAFEKSFWRNGALISIIIRYQFTESTICVGSLPFIQIGKCTSNTINCEWISYASTGSSRI